MLCLRKMLAFSVIAIISGGAMSADAQIMNRRGPFDTCNTCQVSQPVVTPVNCGCLETTMVPRQKVTYRNVTETRYRQETLSRLVPVTVYQQQLSTRMVPYTVSRQVPEVRTVYQPQTIVRTPYGYAPMMTARAPIARQQVPQVQAYIPASRQTTSAMPPKAAALDLKQLDSANSSYDAVSPLSYSSGTSPRPVGRSAASVFRRFQ